MTMEEIIKDPKFSEFLTEKIDAYKNRPPCNPGSHYRRTPLDAAREEYMRQEKAKELERLRKAEERAKEAAEKKRKEAEARLKEEGGRLLNFEDNDTEE